MNKRNNFLIAFVISLAIFIPVIIIKGFNSNFVFFIIAFYSIMTITAIISNRGDIIQSDELSKLAELKSFKNVFIVIFLLISSIGLIDFFDLYTFQTRSIVFYLLAAINITFWISKYFYLKKPEAQ